MSGVTPAACSRWPRQRSQPAIQVSAASRSSASGGSPAAAGPDAGMHDVMGGIVRERDRLEVAPVVPADRGVGEAHEVGVAGAQLRDRILWLGLRERDVEARVRRAQPDTQGLARTYRDRLEVLQRIDICLRAPRAPPCAA
jgi:hypothetical protein